MDQAAPHTDVIVVGRGLLGSAAAGHLAAAGVSVTLVGPSEPADRATHNGVFGSHYDCGRITRVLERDPYFARLAAESINRYAALEARTGITFYAPVGHLAVSGMGPYVDDMVANARSHGSSPELLDHAAIAARWPELSFAPGLGGVADTTGGHMDPRRFIDAHSAAIQLDGGYVVDDLVVGVESTDGGLTVALASGRMLTGDRALLATGAFANNLGLLPAPIDIRVDEHCVILGEVSDADAQALAHLPSVIYKRGDMLGESTYWLPPIRYPDGRTYVKIGQSVGKPMAEPVAELDAWFKGPGDAEIIEWLTRDMHELVPGLSYLSTHVSTCVVTTSPTSRQYIDTIPDTRVHTLLAPNGQVAKSADELGRIAAHRLIHGVVPAEYAHEDFALRWRD